VLFLAWVPGAEARWLSAADARTAIHRVVHHHPKVLHTKRLSPTRLRFDVRVYGVWFEGTKWDDADMYATVKRDRGALAVWTTVKRRWVRTR
jgi:hypothetical protein